MIKHLPIVLCDIPQKAQRVMLFTCTLLMLLICSTCSRDKTPETPPDPSPTPPGGGTETGTETTTYTVTFNTNEGSELKDKDVNSGDQVARPENPTPPSEELFLVGWFTDNETFNNEHNFSTAITENITLYAKWEHMVTYDANTRAITGLNPNLPAGNVELFIPSVINEVKIDSIRAGAFANEPRIVSLSMAEGIKHIGDSAFKAIDLSVADGTGGERIAGQLAIPNSVLSLGAYAFAGNGFTGSLTLGRSLRSIGNSAFASAGFTGSLVLGDSLRTIEESAFAGTGFSGSITIGISVTIIGDGAFADITAVSTVIFTSSLAPTTIGEGIFSGIGTEDDPLEITIPDGATDSYNAIEALENVEVEGGTRGAGGENENNNEEENNEEGQTFTVTFNANEGSLRTAEGTATDPRQQTGADNTIAEPKPDPTRAGHTFQGWFGRNADQSFGPKYNFATKLTGDTTLYAKWERQNRTVTLDWQYGTRVQSIEVPYGDGYTPPSGPNPLRQGYAFRGWNSNSGGTGQQYRASLSSVTENITLYAQWAKKFTVTFDLNEGDDLNGIQARQETEDDSTIATPSTEPTLENFVFVGWAGRNQDRSFGPIYHFETKLRADTTLYAQWEYMLTYNVDEATSIGTITGFHDRLTNERLPEDLVIPATINGVRIETIGFRAFSRNTRIASLDIAVGIKHIGREAFAGCTGLSGSLIIPSTVETIGNGAFQLCSGFTGNLTIPKSVETIGYAAFNGCIGFTGNLTIPNSVRTIENLAFLNCTGFSGSLTIRDSVRTIGDGAFQSCRGFTGSLTIGDSVRTIGEGAFNGCSRFSGSLRIPNSVETIGKMAFFNCTSFNGSLTIGNSVMTIDTQAFLNCTGFDGNLTIPNSVETIRELAFSGMANIDTFIFENSTPPNTIERFILGISNVNIRVPAGALSTYQGIANLSPYRSRITATR